MKSPARQAPPVIARTVPTEPSGASTGQRSGATRLRQRISSAAILLTTVFLLLVGVGGGTTPANAGVGEWIADFVDMCAYQDEAPAPMSSAADAALYGPRGADVESNALKSVTAYEEYGASGLYWSQWQVKVDEGIDLIPDFEDAPGAADGRDGCAMSNMGEYLRNQIAGEIFGFTRNLTEISISVFRWSADPNLLDSFSEPLDCVIKGCNGGEGLKNSLFLNYLLPVVMFGALWGAWTGLVKKRTTETAQGGLWMLGAATFALIFMVHPGAVADQTNKYVGKISASIINGVTSATSGSVKDNDMCWVQPGEKQRGTRMAACSMYKALLVTPWAAGQFGVPLGAPLEGDTEVFMGNRGFTDLRIVQIEAQTVSQTELASGESHEEIRKKDAKRWESVRDEVADGIGTGKNKANFLIWAGDQPSERVNIALASLVASICAGSLLVIISFSTVVLAIAMILLIMMAPLFLLIGVHPGFGRGIALKWLELLIGTAFKRIVLSAMLAILVGMYQVILETDMSWLSQIALITALGIGAIIFRKPMLDTLNVVNLGGTRTGMESGMDRGSKRVAAAGAGAAGGAVGGVMAGGGVGGAIAGSVRGGVMGSRSGSPMRAATMGQMAGRRAGARRASRGAAEERTSKRKQKERDQEQQQQGTRDTSRRRDAEIINELDEARLLDELSREQRENFDALSDRFDDLERVVDERVARPGQRGMQDRLDQQDQVLEEALRGQGPAGGSGSAAGGVAPRPQSAAPRPAAPTDGGGPTVGHRSAGLPTAPPIPAASQDSTDGPAEGSGSVPRPQGR